MWIELIAQREISGDYGYLCQGARFHVQSEEDAESLIERGLAKRFQQSPLPSFNAESFKMHTPAAENKMQPEPEQNKQQPVRKRR